MCPFCYAPKVPGRLSADNVLSWAEELDRAGALGIGFGGGEPTAHPEFVRICVEVARRTRLAVSFTTHGHRVGPDMAAPLRGSVHFIRVSMDGVGRTYEQLRGRSFDAFRSRLDVIRSVAPFGLNVVVNDATVCELDSIAAFATREGATELLLLPEQRVADRPGISTFASELLAEWLSTVAPGVRLAISQAGATDAMPLADPFPDEAPLDAHAHVDARGVLKPHAYAGDGVPIGASIVESLGHLRSRRRT